MPAPLTAPDDTDLANLGLPANVGEEPWVRSVSFPSEHATVQLTWDAVAASVHVLWSADADGVVVELTRETVDTVTIDRHADGHHVAVTSRSDGLAGRLTVTVTSAGVRIHDAVLRA